MQNLKMEVNGDELLIRIDLSKNCGPSHSGKSIIIATIGGNTEVPGQAGSQDRHQLLQGAVTHAHPQLTNRRTRP